MKRLMIAPLCGLSLIALCAAAETGAQTKPGEGAQPALVAGTKASPVAPAKAVPPPSRARRHAHRKSAGEASVALANRAATLQPAAPGFINAVQVFPFAEGTLYQVYAAPERVTDITLQPGEGLISVAAGDTVRWVIGDTSSGSGSDRRTHILIKPFSAGLSTNLVITSDRRTYHLALASTSATAMVALSWIYPQDELIALKRDEEERQKALPVASGIAPEQLHFDYAITGDRSPWRPLRAFDDGRQTFIEFPASLAVGEAPPLFLVDAKGQAQLVNYRLQGRFYIVDRLFDAAELRLGLKHQDVVRIERAPADTRNGEAVVTKGEAVVETAKADPESLEIRARPRRAIRFRRGVIIAAAALGSVSLTAVTWMALKPAVLRQVAQEEELSQPSGKAPPDSLSSLPSSYGDVPKLGPPLPGDLGRPILERQRQLIAEGQASAIDPAAQAEAAERERRLSERKAARESGLLVTRSQAASVAAVAPAPSAAGDAVVPAAKLALDRANDPNNQQRKADFVSALDPRGDVNSHGLTPSPSPYLLSAGSVIPASLITGLRSDLPGLVTAQVTERIYDSPTGRILLIPQGARLIGNYDSVIAFGQRRALIIWQRIMLPDGSSIRIDNVPATDPAGFAGLGDKVDFHTWQLIKGVALSTLLGVGSELAFTGDSDLVEALRRSTQDNVGRAGDQITLRNLNIQPTITIRPGAPVRLVVHKDLVLAPWRE